MWPNLAMLPGNRLGTHGDVLSNAVYPQCVSVSWPSTAKQQAPAWSPVCAWIRGRPSGSFGEGVVSVPVCEKCGEVYADMSGECPNCRKKKQHSYLIWVVTLFAVTIVGAVAYRIFLW